MTSPARGGACLAVLLFVGCASSGSPISTPPATPVIEVPTASPQPVASPSPSTAPTSTGPVITTEYTPEDEQIAELINAGVDEAVPRLRGLNDMDPEEQLELFEPIGIWLTAQRADVADLTPSSCTVEAVALYLDGIRQFDAIRQKFLAWKDWGAQGHAYPPGAPRVAADTLEEAAAELQATCPA
jgi:hypothetical protein